LLNEYATRNSEEAFRTLVERYAGMVYHTALRQAHDPEAAEEVAQAVFIALAQKADRVPRQTLLYGWLFRATRFAVLNWIRNESCRRRHEKEAMSMEISSQFNEPESVWDQISPHLNDALERLSSTDREIVMRPILREQKP
jgi:RNA polymerase sigma factor (sigma-70 family)